MIAALTKNEVSIQKPRLGLAKVFFHKLKMETARSQKNDHQDQKCGIDVTPRYSFGHAFFFPLIMHFFEIGCGDFNARLCLAGKLRLHFFKALW